MDNEDKKIQYLTMIQSSIDRMSSSSAILKGFSATVVTGISAISFKDIENGWILMLLCLPILGFFMLDIYYLQLERKFRFLYEQVRLDNHDLDFSMKLTTDKLEIIKSNAQIKDCLKSFCIWGFYLPICIVVLGILALKFNGIL